MYTIDLFETPGTGPDPRAGAAYIPSAPGKPGSRQRALGNANLAMLIKAINTPGTPPVTLNFLDGRSYTLKPKDLNLIADYYEKELDNEIARINFIYRTLTSYNKTIKLLNTLSQGTLFEADKDLDFKSTKLSRLATQARAQFPDASSDLEALAAFFVTHQQDDADKIQKLNTQYQKQSDIIKKNQALDSEQQKVLRNIQREIDNVEQENDSLQTMQQQMVAANDRLRQQLDKMQQKRKDREEPAAQQKLAVAPAPEVAKEPEEPKAKRVAKAPAPKARTARRTKAQIEKDRASQQAFAQAAKGLVQTPLDSTTTDEPTDLEKSAAADAIQRAQATARAATAAKAQQHFPGVVPSLRQPAEVDEVHDIASGQMGAMIEDELDEVSLARHLTAKGKIDPLLKARSIASQQRPQAQTAIQPTVSEPVEEPVEPGEQMTAQDLLFKTAAKAMYDAGQAGVNIDYEDAIRIASNLMGIPYAPSMLPALQYQLDAVKKKIDALKSVKKNQRAREKEKLTHQTTPDEERRTAEWMKQYHKRITSRLKESLRSGESYSAKIYFKDGTSTTLTGIPSLEIDLKQYFAKKGKQVDRVEYDFAVQGGERSTGPERHEPGSGSAVSARTGDQLPEEVKLDRSGQKMYQAQEAYMIVHNGKEVAFYKPSEMKQAYADAEGLAKRFGGEVHVRKVMREGRAGYNPLTSKQHWQEVKNHLTKLLASDMPYADKQVIRQRYLEKQKEAQQKGWEK